MEHLVDLLISYPVAMRAIGRLLVGSSGALALLAMRIDKVFHRLEARGIPHPSLETVLPGWLYWAVPESALGWFVVVALFVSGIVLAIAAKQIERALR